MKNRNQVMKCNETRHYKMYKAGKRFLYASVSMVTLGSWMFLSQDVHAATQTSTAVAPSTTAIGTDSGQVRTHSDAQASSNQATPAVSNQATTDTSTSSVKTINQLDGQYIDDKGNVSSTKPSVATGGNQAAVTNNKIPTSVNDNFTGQGGQNDSTKHVAIDSTGDYGKVYQDAENKQWVKLVDNKNSVAASYSFKNQIDTTSSFHVQGEWYMSKDNPGGGLGVILQPVNPQVAGISKTSDASVDIGIQGQPNTTFLGFDGYTSDQPDDHDTKPGTLTIRQTDDHTTSIGTSGGGFNPLTLDDDQSINAQYVQQAGPDDLLGKIAQLLIGTKPDRYQDSPYATIGLPDAPADPNLAGPELDVLFDIQWLPNSDIADFDNKVSGTLSVAVYDTTDTAMQNPLGKVVTDNTELPSATSIALFGAMGGTGAVQHLNGTTIPGGLIQGRINSYSFEKVPQTVTVNYINNDTGEQISSQKTTTINASVGNTLEVTETTSGKTASYGAPVIPGYTFLGAVGTDVAGNYQKNSMDVVNTQMLANTAKGHYNTINVYYTQHPSVTRTIDAYQVPKTESTPAQAVPQVTQSSVGNIVAVTPEIGVSLPGKTPIKDARNQNIKLSAGLSPISIRPADGYTSGYTIKGKGNWIAATDIPPINGTDGNTYIVQYAANKIKEQFVDQNGTAIIPDGEITGLAKGMIVVTPASIPGYTYDAGYKATTTDNPVRLTVASLNGQSVVTLHYRANDQKINVQFKDQNGKSLDNVELTGVSDGVVNYQPVFQRQQALLSQGYTLNVAKNGLAAAVQNFDRDDHATPNYVVYLNKIENTTALTTLTPVLQTADGSITPVPHSAVTKVEQVPGSTITAQTIEGYTPVQSQITIPTPVPTSENFVNGKFIGTNINVVYTPNEGNRTVVITTNKGSKTITGIDGRTGQTVNIPIPSVDGYTPNRATLTGVVNPDGSITVTTPKNPDKTDVTYTGNPTSLTITFVSQEKGEAVVGTQILTGKVGDQVQAQTAVPAHYVLVNENDKTVGQTLTSGDNSLTIKVKHQHSAELPADFNGTTTRTINFTGVNGTNPKAVTQTANWTTDTDLATGVTTYVSKDGYGAFDVPAVDGYTADQDTVPAVTNQSTTAKPTNRTVTVTYKGKATSLTVTYADQDDDGAAVGTQVLAGKVGDEVKGQANVPDNYELVSDNDQTIDQTLTADGNALTVKVKHQHSTALPAGFDGTTTRTINFSGVHGTNPKSVIQTANWTTDTDLATGKTTYTSKDGYEAVTAPTVDGYTADQDMVPAEANQVATEKPADSTVNVVYAGKQTNLTITYADQDNGGTAVGTQVLAGKVGDEVKGQANVPTNYELVSDNDQTIDQTLTADGNALTIKVKHQHSTVLPADFNGTTTRTINFTGVNGTNPKAVTQTANWTTDTDLAAGVTTYTPLDGYEAVTVPTVAGYTADQDTVPAYTNQPTTAKPENSVLNVIYTGNQTNLAVTFVDQDNGGITVGTQKMTGKVGDEVKVQANVPANYELVNANDQTIDQTLAADGNTLMIKVKHQHSTVLPADFNGTTTRTINFTGVNGANPKAITQTANWTTDTDLATGVTTYTPLDGYEAVTVPTVTGYTADQDTVPAETNQVPTEKPADSTVSVVYKADSQSIQVRFVDKQTGKELGATTLSGFSDDNIDYQPAYEAQQNILNQGYTLNKKNQNGLSSGTRTFNVYGKTPTYVVELNRVESVELGKVTTDGVPSANQYTINFTNFDGNVVGKITFVGNADDNYDFKGNLPEGYVLTPGQTNTVVSVPKGQDPKTPLTVNVTTPAGQDTDGIEVVTKEQVANDVLSANQYTINFTDYNGNVVGTTTVDGNPGDSFNITSQIPKGFVSAPGKDGVVSLSTDGDSSQPISYNVTTPAGQDTEGIEVVTREQVANDVLSANQYTINFTDYSGNIVSTTTFDGNAGDNYDFKDNLPKGYVLTPGQTSMVVSVPKGQDSSKPLTVHVTTPAGQTADGIEAGTKEQVVDDAPSANQYTINFTDYSGNVVSTTTFDGNAGDNCDFGASMPEGYVLTPGNIDTMITVPKGQDIKTPLTVNVTTPAGLTVDGIEVGTKEQVNDDVASANQYTISFMDYSGNVVGTTSFAGNAGDNYDFQANLPEGYVLTPGQTSKIVSVPKGQDPSKPLTVHVTTPAGQTADGIEVGTKEQVAKDVPSANQYMINFTDYSGKVVGTATVDGNAGDSFNITSQLPKGYVSAPGEGRMVILPTDENSDQSIGYHVTTPAGQDTDGIQSFFAEKVLSNSQSVTQDDYYDYTQPGQLTDGIQTFFKGQVSDGQSVNGNQYYDYMLAGQLAAGIHSYFKGQVLSDSPSVALDKYYDLTQKNHAAEDDLTSVSESNATAGRGSSKADRLDNHGEISNEVSGQSNGGAVANIGTNSETHSGMSAGAAASTSEARVTLQSQKSASQNRLPQNKAQTTANKMPQTNEQRAEIASLLGSELLLGSIGLHEMKRKKHSH
ncbi:adhesion exoprotein [Secundilactobacillus pentosiphilus]|uniref:Adhesion exoprotein n=1 Tax=Secundilactobacillus pentosiphilus TaxID=1714682 RepID=A0A1Z5IQL8_9LACO|nr:MucBP domain-containing protein [Secundilactobacillus pentosiphilus]GAX03976.1 adhesion exoprotein [Secundilactobacillus pentosiphilus]